MFEYFRVGHEPACDDIRDAPDLFNDAAGIDPLRGDDEDDPTEEEEPLF